MEKTTNSTKAQIAKLKSLPLDVPIVVLNLFEFNDQAKYQPEDPEYGTAKANVTGREAMQSYFEAVRKINTYLQVQTIVGAEVDQVLVGPENIQWDMTLILKIPNRQTFVDLMFNPEFHKASRHRKAALANHYNIHIKGGGFKL